MITEHTDPASDARATVSECAVIYAWEFGDDLKETLRAKDLYEDLARRAQEHGETRVPGRVILHAGPEERSDDTAPSPSTTRAVLFLATPCHFGGIRVWFECPGRGDGAEPCGERVGALYLRSSGGDLACRECLNLTYECRTRHREFAYEHIHKPAAKLQRVIDRLNERDEISATDIHALYEAEREACAGVAAYRAHAGPAADRPVDESNPPEEAEPTPPGDLFAFPSFGEWVDRFRAAIEQQSSRAYGERGRCTAVAKTTGGRCRQPAVGEHGKCYYHGGASEPRTP